MATLLVPPPTSTFMQATPSSRVDTSTAPEPKAARIASRLWPAVAHTNFPASSANNAAIASAFSFLAASPVTIRAPVSMSPRVRPARAYASWMKSLSFSVSMVSLST